MIIDFTVSIKDYSDKILNNYGIWEYECPFCKAKHRWNRHATYSRFLLFVEDNTSFGEKQIILRLQCQSCGHTQAILPKECIPFQLFSICSVVKILSLYYQTGSCKKVFDQYAISWQLLYHFVKSLADELAAIELLLRRELLWRSFFSPPVTQVVSFLMSHGHLMFPSYFRSNRKILFLHRKSTVYFPFKVGAKIPLFS